MKESEIIIVNDIPSQVYYSLIKESVMYAIISLPFTVNRMSIKSLDTRIENIAKGKIAEKLFKYYCELNFIPADFKSTTTPFYKVDKRDFILNGYEWDIKNNFIHHDGNLLDDFKYKDLPALIPAKNDKDQWSKREKAYFDESNGVRFLFIFLKATDRNSRKQFLEIKLSDAQKDFLKSLINKFYGKEIIEEPINPEWFWQKMNEYKDDIPSLEINDLPNLVITGFADSEIFDQFKITNSGNDANYLNYVQPQWYQIIKKENGQLLKFLNGTIWTRIPNATLPVSKLKAFSLMMSKKSL